MPRKEIGAVTRLVNTKEPSFVFCLSTCYSFTWKWNGPICLIVLDLGKGHPMVDYESRKALYSFTNVHKDPKMHWYDNLDWIMAMFTYA
jgi:hypothetical protein